MLSMWEPIQDLPVNWESLRRSDLHALAENWAQQSSQIKQSPTYEKFMTRLRRKIAIETGVIERLYTIDRGTTLLLIERGIDEALIAHGTTDQPASQIVALIRDHEAGIESVFDFVAQRRPLSTSYIKELHALLTRNQDTVEGRDQFGNRTTTALIHGDWKKQPNNPMRPNGEMVHYCPPIQTASQMDQLVAWHLEHVEQNVPAEIEAAWLHHRFTLIHPFQDGNGRVVRLLATLVFLRAGWFPLVITTDERGNYIQALETADQGDLKPLVNLFARLQIQELDKAISLTEETPIEAPFDVMLTEYAESLARRRQAQEAQQQADQVMLQSRVTDLVDVAFARFNEAANTWKTSLQSELTGLWVTAKRSSGNTNEHYRKQIVEVAHQLDYYANLSGDKHWVHLQIGIGAETRTAILLSFHGFGREFRGVFVCSAGAYRKEGESTDVTNIEPLSLDPFRITINEDPTALNRRFRDWMEDILSAGFAYWANGQN